MAQEFVIDNLQAIDSIPMTDPVPKENLDTMPEESTDEDVVGAGEAGAW